MDVDLNATQLVLDFETLAFAETAIVTRLACTPVKLGEVNITYDELVDRTFYIAISIEDQQRYGRTMDKPTLDWWKTQPKELRVESALPTPNDLSLKDAVDTFGEWSKAQGYHKWKSFCWARGTYFELPKWVSMYENIYGIGSALKGPINTFKFHECRTYNWLLTGGSTEQWEPTPMPSSFVKHNAKHDAAMDAYRLVRLFHD